MSANRKKRGVRLANHGSGITLMTLKDGKTSVIGVVFPSFEFPDESIYQFLEAAYDLIEGLPPESVLERIHEFLEWDVCAAGTEGTVIRGLKTHVREIFDLPPPTR